MSYMRAPKLHQSTARLCPLLIRISGALRKKTGKIKMIQWAHVYKTEIWINLLNLQDYVTYMYSIVPQKVWVTVPSWMDSLHRPKSVNFTCPRETQSQGMNMEETTLLKQWIQDQNLKEKKWTELKGCIWREQGSQGSFFWSAIFEGQFWS